MPSDPSTVVPGRAIVAVDVGNSAIKVGRFEVDHRRSGDLPRPVDQFRTESRSPDLDSLSRWLGDQSADVFVASVYRQAAGELIEWIDSHTSCGPAHPLSYVDFPIHVNVNYPERVGHDRLANAVSARHLKRPDHAAIIVDAGSAITVDLLSAAGEFQGGAILPGWQASALALSAGTDLLPLISTARMAESPPVVGRSTEEAIRSGIYWGSVGSIRELVERIRSTLSETSELYLTGGDAKRLATHFDTNAQCVEHLVLSGIALTALHRLSLERFS